MHLQAKNGADLCYTLKPGTVMLAYSLNTKVPELFRWAKNSSAVILSEPFLINNLGLINKSLWTSLV